MKKVEKLYNKNYSQVYRFNDENIKNFDSYYKLKDFILYYFEKTLKDLKKDKLDVLDLGCGTGRYFHIFNGELINRFVGIDISQSMIEIAKNNPPFKNEINIKNIELINNDFMKIENIGKFDFIYSIGVLGEHIPFHQKIINKISNEFINDGGRFVFTTVCWWYREKWKRLIHLFAEQLNIQYFLYEKGLLWGFYSSDYSIYKITSKYFELEELKLWNKDYPHYLVCLRKY